MFPTLVDMPQRLGQTVTQALACESWRTLRGRVKLGNVELLPTSSASITISVDQVPREAEQLLLAVHVAARRDVSGTPAHSRSASSSGGPAAERTISEDVCKFRLSPASLDQVYDGEESFYGTLGKVTSLVVSPSSVHVQRINQARPPRPVFLTSDRDRDSSRNVFINLREGERQSGAVVYRSETLWLAVGGGQAILVENTTNGVRGRVSIEALAYRHGFQSNGSSSPSVWSSSASSPLSSSSAESLSATLELSRSTFASSPSISRARANTPQTSTSRNGPDRQTHELGSLV